MGIGNGLGRRSPKGVVGNGQLLVDEIEANINGPGRGRNVPEPQTIPPEPAIDPVLQPHGAPILDIEGADVATTERIRRASWPAAANIAVRTRKAFAFGW